MYFACENEVCSYMNAPEQKARVTYDNLLRLIDDRDVCEPLTFLRERELVHYQRFGERKQPRWNGLETESANKNTVFILHNGRFIYQMRRPISILDMEVKIYRS